ncbi:helix-turn-helix domain-containing protein [Sediminibacterium sp.]|jgi:DNA-binding XRE family transcriptional regulator|uniref:helix-turn-helix domain-containing protein n=1 Tax=Sediminibacterium sp. TaxID=1917865 RepID=UPI00269F1E87|nr:helix-turn-helix transcriptional regulator [Sediminibacterium sp.]MDP3393006.1 helix-turn-helix transcriptional regulator [Sediminibacterium sp.]MDP3567212.1 helix-turn-helix transcriptional regulator [Sediminibacterium sp.]
MLQCFRSIAKLPFNNTVFPNIRKRLQYIGKLKNIFRFLFMAKTLKKNTIDWYIISKVKDLRIKQGMSQEELAVNLGISRGFIGHIESPQFVSKYSMVQLNEIAKIFKCSPRDFLPEKPL